MNINKKPNDCKDKTEIMNELSDTELNNVVGGQANYNAQNGRSMMKVAEGAVSSTVEILRTLKEKTINAENDTNTDVDRAAIQKEIDASVHQIDDNALLTFNGKYLGNGKRI